MTVDLDVSLSHHTLCGELADLTLTQFNFFYLLCSASLS